MRTILSRLRHDERGGSDPFMIGFILFFVAMLIVGSFAVGSAIEAAVAHADLREDIRVTAAQKYDAVLTEAQAENLIPESDRYRDSPDIPELGLVIDGKQYAVHYLDSSEGPMLVQPNGDELPRR